jgi:hypothetical protein
MKNLIRNDEDAWGVFEAIRDAKRGGTRACLIGLSPTVQQRYAQYDHDQTNLEQIPDAVPPFNTQQQSALRDCYDTPTKPLALLKRRITRRQSPNAQSKCQYCGIGVPGHLGSLPAARVVPGILGAS